MNNIKLPRNICALKENVRSRMSEKRFLHSVGVAQYAYKMGVDLGLKNLLDLYVAGILHDVAKEMSTEEQLRIMKMPSEVYQFDQQDILSPTLFHGFCAPYVVLQDYPEFAKKEILYAICYHTVGREEMSTFEKVIFLADYIEMNRTYPDCVDVRNMYENGIKNGDVAERILDLCLLKVLDNTLNFLQNRDYFISPRTHKTRNAIFTTLCHE